MLLETRQTYDVEVMDSKNLDDSLFLAKKSINDFFQRFIKRKKRI